MVRVTQVQGLRDPGVGTSSALIGQTNATLGSLINRNRANDAALLNTLLGDVGAGVRDKFSDERARRANVQQTLLKESLPSTQEALRKSRLDSLLKGLDLSSGAAQDVAINKAGLDVLGGLLGPSSPTIPGVSGLSGGQELQAEELIEPGFSKTGDGAFKLGASNISPTESALTAGVPRKARQAQATLDKTLNEESRAQQKFPLELEGKRLDNQKKQFEAEQTQQAQEFIFGQGNTSSRDFSQNVKEGQQPLAVDAAGQPMQGLEVGPKLISRRKNFMRAAEKNGSVLKDAEDTISGTAELVNNYLPTVEAAIRARQKGVNLKTEITTDIVRGPTGSVKTFLTQSVDPDVQAIVLYLNSVPAMASPVAKAAGETRLTDVDVERFLNLMGNPKLGADALEAQSKFFVRKALSQGLNVAAVAGDKSFEDFNSVHQELFGSPFDFEKRLSLSRAREGVRQITGQRRPRTAEQQIATPKLGAELNNLSDQQLDALINRLGVNVNGN